MKKIFLNILTVLVIVVLSSIGSHAQEATNEDLLSMILSESESQKTLTQQNDVPDTEFQEKSDSSIEEKESLTENQTNSNFLTDYLQDIETAKKAKKNAHDVLLQKPVILHLRDSEQKLIKQGQEKRQQYMHNPKQTTPSFSIQPAAPTPVSFVDQSNAQETIAPAQDNVQQTISSSSTSLLSQDSEKQEEKTKTDDAPTIGTAPFGLIWGASKEQIQAAGYILQPAQREDYTEVFQITNPQQNNQTFQMIVAIFGQQNALWCIYAQSHPQKDTSSAEKVLQLYRKYYDALAEKYGHAQEFFTPYSYTKNIEESEKDPTALAQSLTKTVENPIGGPNFLVELQSGQATLYSTFYDDKIGVTLAVNVDAKGKSYISLDYKDLALFQKEQETYIDDITSGL